MRIKRWISGFAAIVLAFSLIISPMPGDSTRTAAAAGGWTTSGPFIHDPSGQRFIIAGINWYGFETTGYVAHGLWARDYTAIVNDVKGYGLNTIRIPFSNQMWETNPVPKPNLISACPSCKGKHSRDILAMIVNYAGSVGLHVILDNHRSSAGNSAEGNGLWYITSKGKNYPEQRWIDDWVSIQRWVNGIPQTLGSADTITVKNGFPTVLGYDLRNEPHTPARTSYLKGANWGIGDGIDPLVNPNPNPFTPACVKTSTCTDWRLAAERAANTILGDALAHGWAYPLIFVEGISAYPTPTGTAGSGPYDNTWWGGNLLGVNGNLNPSNPAAGNPGAPILLNAGGDAYGLGEPVYNQLVYSAHDYGPALYRQSWFNSTTCYGSGCSSSSLAEVWKQFWAHLNLPGGINPVWPGHGSYPYQNTRHDPARVPLQVPVYIGEFGTGNKDTDLLFSGPGSQGQWFTDLTNFIQSSYSPTSQNSSGIAVTSLHWSYWALNTEDGYGLLGSNYLGLANPKKEYSFLCSIQQIPLGPGYGLCGSTGALPIPQ